MGKPRQGGEPTAQEKEWQASMSSHEDMIFSWFGGLSNRGAASALARLEVVNELGLEKVAFGCLPSLPLKAKPVLGKTRAAARVITVDGCAFECSRKTVEAADLEIAGSIVLARDLHMKKVAFHRDIGKGQGVMAYMSEQEVRSAKELSERIILGD